MYKFSKSIGKEPVRVAGTKRKRESTPLLDELEDYEEEEEEIREEREIESPLKVVPVRSEGDEVERRERDREEERTTRERERQREGEREGRREREEGGSPSKVMKIGDREESRSRSQRSSAIAKKIIKVLQVRIYSRSCVWTSSMYMCTLPLQLF